MDLDAVIAVTLFQPLPMQFLATALRFIIGQSLAIFFDMTWVVANMIGHIALLKSLLTVTSYTGSDASMNVVGGWPNRTYD